MASLALAVCARIKKRGVVHAVCHVVWNEACWDAWWSELVLHLDKEVIELEEEDDEEDKEEEDKSQGYRQTPAA